ncbi:enoyl-CoA hydratase-related protein [Aneurinibacillus sp. Ricciae_BoGa-3]|uniref:enoyl-CoA hydratase/isomerase family protein n=1 Tax=Aneurinibacillus sp. Ricciae_BoGa-3 TaxID=3022697 RepID=UPI002341DE9D|nr:enoyl-CoA hydratase-related protein [Aneurinibacillus sp. Ricciae_BoGa-3]WCK52449.1 enoyl-CoA hydratase-related protein [Aneurinibacillus sp. Ricciae_BoGa-3]
MAYQNILLQKEGAIGIIKINRPDVRNALDGTTVQEMRAALQTLEGDKDTSVIVFTGEGEKSFAAGADIRQLREKNALDALAPGMSAFYREVENSSKATIAAINGFALGGGCELAMACDIRIAAEHAKIGLPELNLSIIPGAGGTQRLARLVGKGRALDMILTGEMISAAQAEQIGLVSQCVPAGQLWEAVKAKAEKIMSKGPLAIRLAKIVVNQGFDLDMGSALMVEKLAQAVLFNSEDKDKGTQAFLDKRQAHFQGR